MDQEDSETNEWTETGNKEDAQYGKKSTKNLKIFKIK